MTTRRGRSWSDSWPPRSRSSSRTRSSTRRSPRSPWPAGRSGCRRSGRDRDGAPDGPGLVRRPGPFEWVEPRGGVVGFPRFRPGIQVDVDAFYRILLDDHGTLVGPGHWFDQPRRHFRLGYGWPTAGRARAGAGRAPGLGGRGLGRAARHGRIRRPARRSATRCSRWTARSSGTCRESRRWSRPAARPSGCRATAAWSCGSRRASRRMRPANGSGPRGRRAEYTTTAPDQPGRRKRGGAPLSGQVRRRHQAGLSTGPRRQLIEGDVDVELDLLADEPAAGLERHVPVQAPVLAVDLPEMEPACRPPRIPGTTPLSSASKVTGRVRRGSSRPR